MPLSAKSFTANTVCRMLQRSLALITMPLFTRLLTTTEYGQYNVYMAWTAIFSIFITLNLSEGSFATAMVRYEDSRDKYVAAVQNIGLVFGLVFLALYLPFRKVLNPLLEMPTAFDDFSAKADRNYADCPETAANNAQLLEILMEKHGFTGYSGEWWHYSDTTSYPVEHVFEP